MMTITPEVALIIGVPVVLSLLVAIWINRLSRISREIHERSEQSSLREQTENER